MKKLFIALVVLGLFALAKPVFAEDKCIDVPGHFENGAWVEDTYSCPQGYDEFGDSCRKWVADWKTETATPVCPTNYHYQNNGNWNERCHRNDKDTQPNCWTQGQGYWQNGHWHDGAWTASCDEHTSPSCPQNYSKVDNTCSGSFDRGDWDVKSKVCNNDGHFEQVWVGDTYKDCPAVDQCKNIDEVQADVPDGYYQEDGNCYKNPVDVCENLGGVQSEIPQGYYKDGESCYPNSSIPTDTENTVTFNKDRRCHGLTPPAVTWAVEKDGELTWSAVGGDKVELRFGWVKGFYPFHVVLTNDGHEKVGLGTSIGYWFNWFEMRTLNGCKKGEWTFFN